MDLIQRRKPFCLSLPGERWKEIDFIPNLIKGMYYISNHGRVWKDGSSTKNTASSNSTGSFFPTISYSGGSPKVRLYLGYKKGKEAAVSRLVAAAFLGYDLSDKDRVIHHIDMDIANNHVSNLKVVTHLEHHLSHCNRPIKFLRCSPCRYKGYTRDSIIWGKLPDKVIPLNDHRCDCKHCLIRPLSYEISNYGEIRNGNSEKMLTPWLEPKSGRREFVFRRSTQGRQYSMAQLVAKTFLEEPDNAKQFHVHHLDGDKLNDHVRNITYSNNDKRCCLRLPITKCVICGKEEDA